MSYIYISSELLSLFKRLIPKDEDIVYATYALIAYSSGGKVSRWKSPIVITKRQIYFFQPEQSNIKQGIRKVPLYKTHKFRNYKHIYVASWDFRPKHYEKSGESKKEFKTRWKNFQKIILPHVIESQKEHLKVIGANKNDLPFHETKDLEKMSWFGTQKKLEKHIRKFLPKLEKKLRKL